MIDKRRAELEALLIRNRKIRNNAMAWITFFTLLGMLGMFL